MSLGLPSAGSIEAHAAMLRAGAAVLIPKEAACEQLHAAIQPAVQGK